MDTWMVKAGGICSRRPIGMLAPDFRGGIRSDFYCQTLMVSTAQAHKNLPKYFANKKEKVLMKWVCMTRPEHPEFSAPHLGNSVSSDGTWDLCLTS